MEFNDITINDREKAIECLDNTEYFSCEYTFGNHFLWGGEKYDVKIGYINEFFTAMYSASDREWQKSFLFPAGKGDLKQAIEKLLEYCNTNNIKLNMHSASKEQIEEVERLFPDKFKFVSNRDTFDYIYNIEDLTNLSGKKYHGKRNHIKRFKDLEWSFEEITKENIDDCKKMNCDWCRANGCKDDPDLQAEQAVINKAFEYFDELKLFGGLLRVEGKVVAFTIAERLNEDIVVVHIEKAFADIQGAYPTINNEFIKNCCQSFKYANREEDLGIEGLRKAKLSYKPVIILEKYEVRLK